jgi:hypothetical protein
VRHFREFQKIADLSEQAASDTCKPPLAQDDAMRALVASSSCFS